MAWSDMISSSDALRCAQVLKLWSLERTSHDTALVAHEGLALLSGLDTIPRKIFLLEYS